MFTKIFSATFLSVFISFICIAGINTSSEMGKYNESQKKIYEEKNDGPFSFEKQFDRIAALKKQGKEVGLIVGRAITETLSKKKRPFLETTTQTWAYLDLNWSYGEGPHFVMDACDLSAWEKFPSDLFSHIVFDWTVTDFVFYSAAEQGIQEKLFKELTRVLKPEGYLSFDSGTDTLDTQLAKIEEMVRRPSKANIIPTIVEVTSHIYYQSEIEKDIVSSTAQLKELELEFSKAGEITFEVFSLSGSNTGALNATFNEMIDQDKKRLLELRIDGERRKKRSNESLLSIIKRYNQNSEEEEKEVNVMEHVRGRLFSLGYSSVEFAATRPWGNFTNKQYSKFGFYIAQKSLK